MDGDGWDMDVDTARCTDGSRSRTRGWSVASALATVLVLTLGIAAPAGATPSAEGTFAPDGYGAFAVNLTNSGSETITSFILATQDVNINQIVPSPACQSEAGTNTVRCNLTIEPGASTQMCYSGSPYGKAEELPVGLNGSPPQLYSHIHNTATDSCPLPEFIPGPASGPEVHGAPVSGGAPTSDAGTPLATAKAPLKSPTVSDAWKHSQCEAAYRSWSKKHRHASRAKKKAEAKTLHTQHGCSLSIWK